MLQIGNLIVIIALLIITIGCFIDSDTGRFIIIVGLYIWMVSTGMFIFPIGWIYIA